MWLTRMSRLVLKIDIEEMDSSNIEKMVLTKVDIEETLRKVSVKIKTKEGTENGDVL